MGDIAALAAAVIVGLCIMAAATVMNISSRVEANLRSMEAPYYQWMLESQIRRAVSGVRPTINVLPVINMQPVIRDCPKCKPCREKKPKSYEIMTEELIPEAP